LVPGADPERGPRRVPLGHDHGHHDGALEARGAVLGEAVGADAPLVDPDGRCPTEERRIEHTALPPLQHLARLRNVSQPQRALELQQHLGEGEG
jgi:hypothetical protein